MKSGNLEVVTNLIGGLFVVNGVLVAVFLPEQRHYAIFISLLLALILYVSNYVRDVGNESKKNKENIRNIKKDLNTNNRLISLEKDVEWLKMKKAEIDFLEILKIVTIIILGYIIFQGIMSVIG